jgi:hypothetical protein
MAMWRFASPVSISNSINVYHLITRKERLMKTTHNASNYTVPVVREMTVTLSGNLLSIGKDFVDAVSGKPASKGTVEVNGKMYCFTCTQGQEVAYVALRRTCTKENVRFGSFMSQAI